MNDKFYRSIVFKLIGAVVIIFILMISLTNYMINKKQIQMTEDLLADINRWLPASSSSIVVTVNNAQIQSSADFRIYTIVVTVVALVLGSLIFAFIISKILAPLRELQKNIAKIDIERPETFAENHLLDSGSSEIEDLAKSFNYLMDRIYRDYRRQKDFSANVAHELRTPVAVMKAQVDVFRRKNTDPATEAFIDKMDKNLSKLKNLIDSVLMFSKKEQINVTDVKADELIEEIVFDLEEKIGKKDLKVNINVDPDLIIKTDDALLQRLLYNIIENAIKYNVAGGSIDIRSIATSKNLTLEVADSGIGMTDDQKRKIFDLFYQADGSRSVEGFGIGLSLSKQIAESLGAKIKVLDNVPQGSKFLIIFE